MEVSDLTCPSWGHLPGIESFETNTKVLIVMSFVLGNFTKAGFAMIVIESDKVHQAGLNCYEIAQLILFYNTIPMK